MVSTALLTAPAWCQLPPTDASKQIRLTYERGSDAQDCPDVDSLRDELAARLGYAPFSDDAEVRIVTSIARRGPSLRATIRRTDRGGKSSTRVLESSTGDCEELVHAVAVAIALSVDPLATPRDPDPTPPPAPVDPPDPAPDPTPERSAPPAPVVIAPAPAAPAPSTPFVPSWLCVQAGGFVDLGIAPSLLPGISAQFAYERGALSMGAEARVDLPVTSTVDGAEATTSMVAGTLLPCVHHKGLDGCVSVLLGSLQTEGKGFDAPERDRAFKAAAGIRGGYRLDLGRSVFVHPHGELLAVFTRTTLFADGRAVWVSPPIAARLGAELGVILPL